MSKLLAQDDRRWSLAAAVDALTESARIAGRPSLVWLAGFFYPGVGLGLGLGWSWILCAMANVKGDEDAKWVLAPMRLGAFTSTDGFTGLLVDTLALGCAAPLLFPVFLPVFRSIAGLAAWAGSAASSTRASLREVWRAGRGNVLATGGLWVQCWILVVLVAAVFLMPTVIALHAFDLVPKGDDASAAQTPRFVAGLVAAPGSLVVTAYALAVSMLFQLALQSLAHNRRGAGSALVHAWRLARNDPWATVRALVGDALLSGLYWIAFFLLLALWHVPVVGGAVLACYVALGGFVGVARAMYWARAYRALGGLTPADGVPGLESTR
jgi:hypothetical protein